MLKLTKRPRSPFYQLTGTVWIRPGRTVRVRESTGYSDRKRAEAYAERRQQEIIDVERGQHDSKPHSFRDAAVAYVSSKESVHPNDADRINILDQYFGPTDLCDIDGGAFLSFVGRHLDGRKPTTVNRYRSNLVSVLNFAKQIWPDEVVRSIPLRRTDRPKPRYLSLDDQDRLLDAYHPLVRPLVHVLCFQGSRVGETLRLHWEDINLDRRTITYWVTKNGDFRTVPMHERVHQALSSINRPRAGHIFVTPMGTPYSYDTRPNGSPIKTAHRSALERAGITNFKVHNWRSHWASQMALNGATVYELMALGGWRSVASVSHYVQLNPEHLRSSINRLK